MDLSYNKQIKYDLEQQIVEFGSNLSTNINPDLLLQSLLKNNKKPIYAVEQSSYSRLGTTSNISQSLMQRTLLNENIQSGNNSNLNTSIQVNEKFIDKSQNDYYLNSINNMINAGLSPLENAMALINKNLTKWELYLNHGPQGVRQNPAGININLDAYQYNIDFFNNMKKALAGDINVDVRYDPHRGGSTTDHDKIYLLVLIREIQKSKSSNNGKQNEYFQKLTGPSVQAQQLKEPYFGYNEERRRNLQISEYLKSIPTRSSVVIDAEAIERIAKLNAEAKANFQISTHKPDQRGRDNSYSEWLQREQPYSNERLIQNQITRGESPHMQANNILGSRLSDITKVIAKSDSRQTNSPYIKNLKSELDYLTGVRNTLNFGKNSTNVNYNPSYNSAGVKYATTVANQIQKFRSSVFNSMTSNSNRSNAANILNGYYGLDRKK